MTESMRSLVIERFGDPQQVLIARERPVPQPGPGEVRLKLIQSPIHTHDLELVRGEYGYKPPLPTTPGTEAVGYVDALGPDVTHLQLGQRVCAAGLDAAWAEFFIARARGVVPLPDALSDDAACQLLAMPLSASMLVDNLALRPGDWMIQNTANGAIGRIVNAFATRRGFRVINLVRSLTAATVMRAAGYSHVVSREDPEWPQQVARILQGAKLQHAVDSLGGDAANELLGVLDTGGTLVSFGSMVSLTLNIHVDNLLYKQATLRGFWAAKQSALITAEERARMIREIIDMVLAGELALTVDAAFDLAHAGDAASAVSRPNRLGKVALRA